MPVRFFFPLRVKFEDFHLVTTMEHACSIHMDRFYKVIYKVMYKEANAYIYKEDSASAFHDHLFVTLIPCCCC